MPGLHVPTPSHVLEVTWTPAAHDAAEQTVPAVYFWHALAPLQNPVVPHVDAP